MKTDLHSHGRAQRPSAARIRATFAFGLQTALLAMCITTTARASTAPTVNSNPWRLSVTATPLRHAGNPLRVPHDRANARRLGAPGARSAASTHGPCSADTAPRGRHWDGVDHPLWMFDADRGVTVYFELDTTGNVRRLHAGERVTGLGAFSGDLGGYSYTAFGRNIPSSEPGGLAIPKIDAVDYFQRLQWQGRWLYNRSGGLYDFRARFWSPQLGAFLQLDRYQFLSSGGTLWSWPGQNPFRLRDPSGRYGWEDFGNDFYKHSETAIDVSLSLSFAAGTIATGGLLVEVLGLGTLEAGLTTLGAEALGFGGSLLARTAAAATSAAAMVGRGCSTKGSDNSLIGQLAAQGVKHSPEKIAAIEKIGEKIVFLENGSSRAGLTHIIERHAGDFASRGISAAQIPDAIMGALRNGTVVGMQGTRPIYEFVFNGQVQRIAVTVSDNGYVVGANPAGL